MRKESIDNQIGELLTQIEQKEIDFDTFHHRLTYLESQKLKVRNTK